MKYSVSYFYHHATSILMWTILPRNLPRNAGAEAGKSDTPFGPSSVWINRTLFFALLLLAAALRFYDLQAHSLTRDEIRAVTSSLVHIIFSGETFIHPFFGKLMVWITGSQREAILRVPGACFGVLGVAATYLLGQHMFGKRAALLGAYLLAFSRFEIEFSQDISHYPYFVFLSVLSLFFLHRAVIGGRRRAWWGFAIITVLNVNCHLAAYLVLGVELMWLGLRYLSRGQVTIFREKRALRTTDNLRLAGMFLLLLLMITLGPILTAFFALREYVLWIVSTYVVVAAVIVWLGRSVVARWLAKSYAKLRPASAPKSSYLWNSLAIAVLATAMVLVVASSLSLRTHFTWIIRKTLTDRHFVPPTPWRLLASSFLQFTGAKNLLVPFLFALVIGLWRAWRERREVALLLVLWLTVPWLTVYLPTGHPFYIRFMIFMLPVYLLVVAAGLESIAGWISRGLGRLVLPSKNHEQWGLYSITGFTLIAAGVMGAVSFPSLQKYYRQGMWDDCRGVSRFLEANVQDGDSILLFGQKIPLIYYAPSLEAYITRTGGSMPGTWSYVARKYARVWVVFDLWFMSDRNVFPMYGAIASDPVTRAWMEMEQFARLDFRGFVVLFKNLRGWSAEEATAAEIRLLKQAVGFASEGHDQLHATLGDRYAQLGRWNEAAREYKSAVCLEPKTVRYHWQLGQVYEALGDREAALTSYRQVRKLEPEFGKIREVIQRLSKE